ncbi:hypothetical protein [Mycolicibacterium vaccae]|uniref:Uncharacterized protein n=1 Tax=Mycolicibacterium vaccae ATCC 25954 TaxID=1194972 RepID=K0VAP6_MYCVA|nr:hypothetical protein [Mycolicibacterium vaccae]EJZ08104.1 hypothetical protein MVAC_16615 [Mycolicibacterium vaccae ATCC 25954]
MGPLGQPGVTFTADDKVYGINGVAQRTLPSVDAIWRDGADLGPIIDKGLRMCD